MTGPECAPRVPAASVAQGGQAAGGEAAVQARSRWRDCRCAACGCLLFRGVLVGAIKCHRCKKLTIFDMTTQKRIELCQILECMPLGGEKY